MTKKDNEEEGIPKVLMGEEDLHPSAVRLARSESHVAQQIVLSAKMHPEAAQIEPDQKNAKSFLKVIVLAVYLDPRGSHEIHARGLKGRLV